MAKYDIIEFCPVPPPYGGVTVYVKRLSDRLMSDGFVVGGYYTSECLDNRLRDSSLYYEQKSYISGSIFQRIVEQLKRMKKNTREIAPFNIIHYHGLENLKFIWFLYKYCDKKIVITVHSAMIESFYRRTDRLNKHYMRKLAEADVQWVAVSQQAKECMLRLPFQFKNNIPIVAAYVPIETPDTPLPVEMENYIKGHEKNIAFYGRSFMLNDGVDVYGFEPALRMYADVIKERGAGVGLIFCLSEDKEKDKIERLHWLARELRIDDKIYWQIGAIDNINCLWKAIDVYVRPTSTDGDSVAVREVLDQGVQVIASDVCWRPEAVISYRFGNKQDFVSKVLQALDTGKKDVAPDFSCYNDMKAIFTRILYGK